MTSTNTTTVADILDALDAPHIPGTFATVEAVEAHPRIIAPGYLLGDDCETRPAYSLVMGNVDDCAVTLHGTPDDLRAALVAALDTLPV